MRILHTVRSDGFAGVESHVARLAKAQRSAGHDVVVVGGEAVRMAGDAGPGVRTLAAVSVADVYAAARTWGAGADVVHAHMTAAEIACAAALFGMNVPLVATCHFARQRGSNPLFAVAAGGAARRIDAQIAISGYVAEKVAGPSVVVYPGVDANAPIDRASDRERVVLLAQRLEPEKDSSLALRAFAAAGLARRGWRLEIAGDGAERPHLTRLAERLGIGEVTTFLGHRSDVPKLMRRAGMLLAPCRVEGLGLTVLEAMAAGLPIVAVAAGGHLETVGRVEDAALHSPGDAAGAGDLLAGLAADPVARDAYGARLACVQQQLFTPALQAEETMAVYRSVL